MNFLKQYKYFTFFFCLLFTFNINAQNNNKEFRSTWIITWDYINSGSTVEQNKARIREILDNHKKANMTSVLFQVRQSGTAYYQSSYEPWGYYAGYTYPGFDPLQYAIEEAHKRGLELHAWFNTFSVSSTHPGTIAAQHPEWICRDQSGTPMSSYLAASPGLEAVRNYTLNVAMEIVRNYDIDGLHLDYIRWNEYSTDDMPSASTQIEQESKLDGEFSESTIKKLTSPEISSRFLYDAEHPFSAGVPAGFSTWEDWWRASVTEFVHALHDSIQAVKPWVRLSSAALGKYKAGGTSGWNGYYIVYQDAALWFNESYIDQLTPMHYHWTTGNGFYDELTSDWEPYIQEGIQKGILYSCGPGSYILDENNVWGNHPDIVNRVRNKNWVDGFQFFSYGNWKDYNYWDEAATTFFNKKVKIRNVLNSLQPQPPSASLTKIDSLSYNISVISSSTELENNWFAIYRSEDANLDVNEDLIVDIHFGNSPYIFNDSYSGLQDYNGSYKYFATTLNRFWIESEISNFDSTDLIPSFAPTVVTTIPAENGEINITDDVIIQFSKTMNVDSFNDAILITPPVIITSLNWSADKKKLTMSTENYLYNNSYTLTIASTVTDKNGKFLDGNGDGGEGDPYVLTYHTAAEDIFGPKIIKSFPVNNQANVDVSSILTLEFDEELNPQSLTSEAIVLLNNTSLVEYKYLLTKTLDGRSIISIQPTAQLDAGNNYTLKLSASISDKLGNTFGKDSLIAFTTSSYTYWDIKLIDDFTNPGDWQQPSYSGSTIGTLASGTNFEYSTAVFPPATSPAKSASLVYLWDTSSSTFLIREYLKSGIPQTIYFDTSFVLQTYIYGDGSNNLFRFCIDEYQGSVWGDHEVSNWIALDWNGWKLVEWQLNDPNSIGTWIGDSKLTGSYFRIDSYQLSKSSGGAVSGKVYFDDLRAVQKVFSTTGINDPANNVSVPTNFYLSQNYPNPFNPSTIIQYTIPQTGSSQTSIGNRQFVSLKVYDLLGKEIATLVNEEQLAGTYNVQFTINNLQLSSGTYFYRLQAGNFIQTKKMILLK